MQQHPIPQDIIAYKFRLVGSMTLKQFLELAAGIVTGWLIFSSSLHFLLKWTLGPLAGFFGVALAFLPIQDRPLDQWIINFVKAIYSPTRFIYQPLAKILDIFSPSKPRPTKEPTKKPGQPEKLQEYLKSLPASPTTAFDQAEHKYLEHIHSLFGALGVSVPKKPPTLSQPEEAPPLKTSIKGIRIRKLMTPQMCLLPHATVYQAPSETQQASMPVKLQSTSLPISKPKPTSKPTPPSPPPPSPALKTKPGPKPKPKPELKPTPKPARQSPTPPKTAKPITPTVFAKDIILPQKPEKPNLISGITLDQANKIIPNVILEIRNRKGHPVRALKSNKLGQFFIATPLEDGIYQIEAEHPDHRFAIMKLEVKGEIIPPLKIQTI